MACFAMLRFEIRYARRFPHAAEFLAGIRLMTCRRRSLATRGTPPGSSAPIRRDELRRADAHKR